MSKEQLLNHEQESGLRTQVNLPSTILTPLAYILYLYNTYSLLMC